MINEQFQVMPNVGCTPNTNLVQSLSESLQRIVDRYCAAVTAADAAAVAVVASAALAVVVYWGRRGGGG